MALAGITRGVDQLPIRLFSSDDREKVEVTRRRRGEGSGAGGRERAEAPIRRREDEGAPSAPRSMGGTEDMSAAAYLCLCRESDQTFPVLCLCRSWRSCCCCYAAL